MPHAHQAVALWQDALTLGLVGVACVYLRGLLAGYLAGGNEVSAGRTVSFMAGLFAIWTAAASPLATLDHQWLTAHMIQHLLLMSVAPPLIWLGTPAAPMRYALSWDPCAVIVGPADRGVVWRRVAATVTHPVFCWLAATLTLAVWHVPAALMLGMRSSAWHMLQHVSFLVTGLLFWWPVLRPRSSAGTESPWSMVLYLFLATLPCDALSGFLVFSERVAYPIYLVTSGRSETAVLEDQQLAGALMWTVVTILYLGAAAALGLRSLAVKRGGADRSGYPAVA